MTRALPTHERDLATSAYVLACATNSWAVYGRYIRRCVTTLLVLSLAAFVAAAPDLDKMASIAQQRYGASGSQTVQQWRTLLTQARGLSDAEKIKAVNVFFNRQIAFRDDQDLWQVADYWATPLEILGRGAGDCEDFTIAKYATLKLLGIPIERMRLIYVRAQIGGAHSSVSQAHMVLGYFANPGDEPLILDNLVTEIYPASRRTDLSPVFSFNGEGLWVGSGSRTNATSNPNARLSRWRDVLERMRQEGLE